MNATELGGGMLKSDRREVGGGLEESGSLIYKKDRHGGRSWAKECIARLIIQWPISSCP